MTKEQVQRSLQYLVFLKHKRCGKVKARGCADGRSQRAFISKEEASSSTVSLYALMLLYLIDTIEERDVATANIPGSFDPKLYKKYLVNQNGQEDVDREGLSHERDCCNEERKVLLQSLLVQLTSGGSYVGRTTSPITPQVTTPQVTNVTNAEGGKLKRKVNSLQQHHNYRQFIRN
eukprot:jgi/Psemu1/24061/gm1.24061_g